MGTFYPYPWVIIAHEIWAKLPIYPLGKIAHIHWVVPSCSDSKVLVTENYIKGTYTYSAIGGVAVVSTAM